MTRPTARKDDSAVRVAKLGIIGAIAAAGITAVATLVPALVDDDDDGGTVATTTATTAAATTVATTVAPTTTQPSVDSPMGNGSVTSVDVNEDLAEVTVQGIADSSVKRIYVSIGPDPVTGVFSTKGVDPAADGAWTIAIRFVPGPVPRPTKVAVIFDDGSVFGYGPPLTIPEGATVPPPDPEGDEAERIECLERQGPDCLEDSADALTIDLPEA